MTLGKLMLCFAAFCTPASLSLFAQSVPSGSSSQLLPGIVVKQVTPGWSGEKAGIKPGDILLRWSRGAMSGEITSPFDLDQVEIEQQPRGSVTLEGIRGTEKQSWLMAATSWKVITRPQLDDALLSAYSKAQELEKADAMASIARWRAAAQQARKDSRPWLSSWFLEQAAKTALPKQQWKESDASFADAIQQAAQSSPHIQAQLLQAWGLIYQQRNDWVNAEKYFQQSLAESRKLDRESLAIAATLNNLGIVTKRSGDLTRAEQYYHQALDIRLKLAPGSLAVAGSYNNLAIIAMELGNLTEAEKDYQQSIEIKQRLAPGSLDLASTLGNVGTVAWSRGDLARAEQCFLEALAIQQKLAPDSIEIAPTFNNLGVIAWSRGDLAKAEDYYRKTLDIMQKVSPGSLTVADAFSNLGDVSNKRGDMAKAENYYRQSLEIQQKLAPDSLGVAASLNNLAVTSYARGDLARADQYCRQAMEIQQKVAPASLDVAESFNNLGNLAAQRGDVAQAGAYFRQALEIKRKLAPGSLTVAQSLNDLGDMARRQGDFARAKDDYQQALAIREKLAPGSSEVAESLSALADVRRHDHDFPGAERLYERALTALKLQTSRLGGSQEVRTDFRAQHADYYREYGEVLLAENKQDAAFYVLERSRARSLLEMFAERDMLSAADVPPELLIARRQNAAAYDTTQAQLADLSPMQDAAKITNLLQHLHELEDERDQIAERIKKASPRLAQLQYPQPLDVSAARNSLDRGTVLLEYSVGPRQSTLFVLQPAGVIPGLSVFRLPIGDNALRKQVEIFRRLIERHDSTSDMALRMRARALYNILLRPAEALLQNNDRILLAPDGPLYLLPFAALMRGPDQYLVEWKPLHEIASATVYAEIKARRNTASAATEFVAFADPEFPSAEKTESIAAKDPQKEKTQTIADSRETARGPLRNGFLPLPGSREEVTNIAALFPGHSYVYLGADATEGRAKSVGNNVKYLHFATHAFLNTRFPLDSALVLTVPENPAEGQENGFLQAWEISQQMRLNADLVTLSACDSGLGQELSGEGLIGLTRSFLYAGAHSVIASRWSVDDQSTAELMTRLYRHLQQGEDKDTALQHAQKEMAGSSHYTQPYYWAAFYLSGDWR